LAGVPSVMQVMLDAATRHLKTGKKMHSVAIDVHRPEGDIAELLATHQNAYPDVPMGSYPFFRDGRLGTQLVLRSTEAERLNAAAAELREKLATRGLI
jgi:molybdopterin-biosynthesis enzyme MoeA-like protein